MYFYIRLKKAQKGPKSFSLNPLKLKLRIFKRCKMENTGYVYIGIRGKGNLKGHTSEEFTYVCYHGDDKPNLEHIVLKSAFCFSPEKIVENINMTLRTEGPKERHSIDVLEKVFEDNVKGNKALHELKITEFKDLCKFSNLENISVENPLKPCYYRLKTNGLYVTDVKGQQMWRWSFSLGNVMINKVVKRKYAFYNRKLELISSPHPVEDFIYKVNLHYSDKIVFPNIPLNRVHLKKNEYILHLSIDKNDPDYMLFDGSIPEFREPDKNTIYLSNKEPIGAGICGNYIEPKSTISYDKIDTNIIDEMMSIIFSDNSKKLFQKFCYEYFIAAKGKAKVQYLDNTSYITLHYITKLCQWLNRKLPKHLLGIDDSSNPEDKNPQFIGTLYNNIYHLCNYYFNDWKLKNKVRLYNQMGIYDTDDLPPPAFNYMDLVDSKFAVHFF